MAWLRPVCMEAASFPLSPQVKEQAALDLCNTAVAAALLSCPSSMRGPQRCAPRYACPRSAAFQPRLQHAAVHAALGAWRAIWAVHMTRRTKAALTPARPPFHALHASSLTHRLDRALFAQPCPGACHPPVPLPICRRTPLARAPPSFAPAHGWDMPAAVGASAAAVGCITPSLAAWRRRPLQPSRSPLTSDHRAGPQRTSPKAHTLAHAGCLPGAQQHCPLPAPATTWWQGHGTCMCRCICKALLDAPGRARAGISSAARM